ncbi:MAG: phosphoribosylaminoimidazolesuccinocarboxamide synthase, partial [Firmicutes bacterium]|nr:phosphoribosylaminoimidazolesuccinocarboxamide synthase [Bacillota bacterium]
EVTLKDDERNDPPVTTDILSAFRLLTIEQYDEIKAKTLTISAIVYNDLESKGLELIDIKFEFGLVDGVITLIDEISGGNMRAFKNGKKLDYETLSTLILA